MRYDNSSVRRQDRLLEQDRAEELLRNAEYGTLSMVDNDQNPYGIPVNYVWDGENSLYIHCAPVGRKLDALKCHPEVSFCIVGRVRLLPERFTTEYESIILTGTAHLDLKESERRRALRLLLEKLSPNDMEVGLKYAEKSFHRTSIIRLDITHYSGKCKRMPH